MNFEYSAKNIPIAEPKIIKEMMIQTSEKFMRTISWKIWHKTNPNPTAQTKETYGFKSTAPTPILPELKPFKKDLVQLLQGTKFRKRSNRFLEGLRNENFTTKRSYSFCRQNDQQLFGTPKKI